MSVLTPLFCQVGIHLLLLGAGFLPLYSIYRLLMSPLSTLQASSKSVVLGWIFGQLGASQTEVVLEEHFDPVIHASLDELRGPGSGPFVGFKNGVREEHGGFARSRPLVYRGAVLWQSGGW